ncbi:hypothetical protein GOV06_03165 [Candidatus Woesearchaeota archaeon]|nr:hypothetical protein [Candidatus Woesearchaeota archaeon]
MAKAKRKTSRASSVKKTWYPILAPKLFNSQAIGETYIAEPSKSIGKTVAANLMNLTRDMRKQNLKVIFEITNATSGKFYTDIIGYEMISSSIKRMIRRGKRKIDYSFKTVTADGYRLQLKVIMITIGLANLSSLTRLRKICKEELTALLSKTNYLNFVDDLVNHKFQGFIKKKLSKAYPLRTFELRFMKVMKKGKAPEKEVEKEIKKEVPKEEVKKEVEKEAPKEEAKPEEEVKKE